MASNWELIATSEIFQRKAENHLTVEIFPNSAEKSDLSANTLDIRRTCRHIHMLGLNRRPQE
jgi:hypothetical protein